MFAVKSLKGLGAGALAAILTWGLSASARADDITFVLLCNGSANHPSGQPDSFDTGILTQDIAEDSDTRFWTPGTVTEAQWDNNTYASWHYAYSGPDGDVATAKSKAKGGLSGTGNEIVTVPRVRWINSVTQPSTGHAYAMAASGGPLIAIPGPSGPIGHLGIEGGMLGAMGSQWTSFATPTQVDASFPVDTPFQLDVVAWAEVSFPDNVAHVVIDVLVDGAPVVSGMAELMPGGYLFADGVLTGVFSTPMYEPIDGELFAELEVALTLPEGWYVWSVDCPGDLDGDGDVDLGDLATLLANYGQTSGMIYEDGDLTGDGAVTLADLAELLALYGTVCD